MNTLEMERAWDSVAENYARVEKMLGRLGLADERQRLLSRAYGRVLDVSAGPGTNLPFYSPLCEVTAIDLSRAMLNQAGQVAHRLGRSVARAQMDAHNLAFADRTFDTVVVTMALCTIAEPVNALHEIRRVCRPDGQILFIKHVRSPHPFVAAMQQSISWLSESRFGCHWCRDTVGNLQRAGLRVEEVHDRWLGMPVIGKATP